MEFWENLVEGDLLIKAKKARRVDYVEQKIYKSALENAQADGYELISEYADGKHIKVRKRKTNSELFENRVWLMLYNMGYTTMNKDSQFNIVYEGKSHTKQIDVFAYDGETALVIECKAAEKPGTGKDFKTELEAIKGYRDGVQGAIFNRFGRGVKVKFIFATENYVLGDADKSRLADFHIAHFDEAAVSYNSDLAQHLGTSSKYQLLGNLFSGTKIENMNDAVPAIRGKMGGHVYYAFSIEPERLLKISYVLHRSDANESMMPTYQRIIKKSRLAQVREFVDDGGFFPNSIVVSIDAPPKGLKFDIKDGDGIAKIGILHLPKKYQSAYVIDGQHRLYGYTDSEYAATNTIPVVAFENLSRAEQVRLFMEINENQKAVPKNLRNTLNIDLLWDSKNYSERRHALRLRIAEMLGGEKGSPLAGHVLVGENKKDAIRCITMETFDKGLKSSGLITSFNKDNCVDGRLGYLDSSEPSNQDALSATLPFLKEYFAFFRNNLTQEWDGGEANQGLLTNNTGIYALIRILGDMLAHLEENDIQLPSSKKFTDYLPLLSVQLNGIVRFYAEMNEELRTEIRSRYGDGGATQHWRYLQKAVKDAEPTFNPQGFERWWADNSKQYNEESARLIKEIKVKVVSTLRDFVEEKGIDLPLNMRINLNKRVLMESDKTGVPEDQIDQWGLFGFSDCHALAQEGTLWSDGLKDILTRPEQSGRKGGNKAAKIAWLEMLDKEERGLGKPGHSVNQADYEAIVAIANWQNASHETENVQGIEE